MRRKLISTLAKLLRITLYDFNGVRVGAREPEGITD